MTDVNHRRRNRKPVNLRHPEGAYRNGFAAPSDKSAPSIRVGRTDFLDKSMHSWAHRAPLSDRIIGAGIGNDFTDGHRGMAKAVRGAKKFVRSRLRFHENAATTRAARRHEEDVGSDAD